MLQVDYNLIIPPDNHIIRYNLFKVAPVAESISSNLEDDTISEMCKELSQGLKLLSSNEDPFVSPTLSPTNDMPINNLGKDGKFWCLR